MPSWAARLAALAVDLAVSIGVPWLTISIVLFGALTFLGPGPSSWEDEAEVVLPSVFVGGPLVASFVYHVVGWSLGRTVGMSAAGMELTTIAGAPPGFGRGLARAVPVFSPP